MKYKVTKFHHRKAWFRGDLEAETIVVSVESFPTKKTVVQYLEREANSAKREGYNVTLSSNIRGNMPSLSVFTGKTWIHENTGETEHEGYIYKTETV